MLYRKGIRHHVHPSQIPLASPGELRHLQTNVRRRSLAALPVLQVCRQMADANARVNLVRLKACKEKAGERNLLFCWRLIDGKLFFAILAQAAVTLTDFRIARSCGETTKSAHCARLNSPTFLLLPAATWPSPLWKVARPRTTLTRAKSSR